MTRDPRRPVWIALVVLPVVLAVTVPAAAQFHEADPEAMKAFESLVEGYRQRPALTVRSTVGIEVSQDDIRAGEREASGELTFTRDGRGVFKVHGFTTYLGGGTISAVHEGTDHSYFTTADDGSPFYALLSAFVDLPFPHLALAFGEENIEDLCMQLHPRAPWVRPTAVRDLEDGEGRRLTFTSDFSSMDVDYDPETGLLQSIELKVTGGDLVQPGAVLVYRHAFEYEIFDAPPDPAEMTLDPGPRQRVDLLASLVPRREPPAGAPLANGRGPSLVGQPAPPLALATAAGKEIDLAGLAGQVVVLDFWATWCGPCRTILPRLHEVATWAADEQMPVTILTVNVWEVRGGADRDTPEARLRNVRSFWEKNGFTLPVAMDYEDQVVAAYGVSGIPSTFVIRSDGVVHAQHTGAAPDYAEALKRDIQQAIEAVEAQE